MSDLIEPTKRFSSAELRRLSAQINNGLVSEALLYAAITNSRANAQAKRISELEAALAAVTAERDALKVDAGRWQHLRAHSTYTDRGAYSKPNGDGLVSPLTRRWYHDSQYLTLDTLDAAIDAAIKEQQ